MTEALSWHVIESALACGLTDWEIVLADNFDIAVIGGGIAGLTAAHHALLQGCSVAHVLGLEPMGGLVCNVGELHGVPSGEQPVSGINLALGIYASNASIGVHEMLSDASSLVQQEGRFAIETSDGSIMARIVIAAMGARLRMLDVPGAAEFVGRGVSQCAWCDGFLYTGKEVVVVGGGDSALEEALHLAQHAAKVTIVTRGDRLRARPNYIARVKATENIEIRLACDVTEVVGGDGVEAVRLANRQTGEAEEIACAGVFVFIGLEPISDLLGDLVQRDGRGYVETNASMETLTPGLFAVGAVRAGYGGRLVQAMGEAATAAIAAAARCKS